MKYITCINKALEQKAIDQETADQLKADVKAYEAHLSRGGEASPAIVEAMAADKAVLQMLMSKQRSRYQKALQILANRKNCLLYTSPSPRD